MKRMAALQDEKIIPRGALNKARKKRYPITFITVVFALVFIFFAVQGFILLKHHHVEAYNIGMAGSDNVTGTHEGLILREESVISAEKDGFAGLYALNGTWITKGEILMTIDSSGDLKERIRSAFYGRDVLGHESRTLIQDALKKAAESYDGEDFSGVYREKARVEETILQMLMKDGGTKMQDILEGEDYAAVKAGMSGFFLTWTDGLEGLTEESISSELFSDPPAITRIRNGDALKEGQQVVKIAADNRFRIAFLLTDEETRNYAAKKTMSIKTASGLEITGDFRMERTTDGKGLGIIFFAKYGGNFVEERFMEFQVLDKSVTGYKIPESAITTKSFFVVPETFITYGADSASPCVLLEGNGDDGVTPVTAYFQDPNPNNNLVIGDGVVYIYSDLLKPGMRIVTTGSDKKEMTLGVEAAVEGVYQINSGYCIFKPVVRLKNSLETSYVVVSAGVKGGLKAYDRIVLYAEGMNENEIIFE